MALPEVGVAAVIENLAKCEQGAKLIQDAYAGISEGAEGVEGSAGKAGGALSALGGPIAAFNAVRVSDFVTRRQPHPAAD